MDLRSTMIKMIQDHPEFSPVYYSHLQTTSPILKPSARYAVYLRTLNNAEFIAEWEEVKKKIDQHERDLDTY